MSSIFPGIFGLPPDADPAQLHEGGLDYDGIRFDSVDIFPNDNDIAPEDHAGMRTEDLPQFGPPFVRYVHHRFTDLERLVARMTARWSYEPRTDVIIASMQTDANGNVNRAINSNSILYEPPPGFTFAVHRLMIRNAGNNFGVPFTAANAYWELRVNDEMLDGGSLAPAVVTVGFPIVRTWGTRDALRVRDGEVLSLFISGTATLANQLITVRGQGTLERQAES